MFSQTIKALQPISVFNKLSPEERQPFMTYSGSANGWAKILAFDPLNSFRIKSSDEIDAFYQFVEQHRGKLIAGYINYDLGYSLHGIKKTIPEKLKLPLIQFAAYDDFLEFRSHETKVHFTKDTFLEKLESIRQRRGINVSEIQPYNFSVQLKQSKYQQNFEKVIRYIKAGDIYQINYTHFMQAESEQHGRVLFSNFLNTNPVNFAAYWELPDISIISLSPESFISIKDRQVITCPIKGTRPRGKTAEEDRIMKQQLLASQKEQAELNMITDLLRNDLGKVSKIGTVRVVHKKRLQTLAGVFHTYSKIRSELRDNISGVEALISMFPGGSVTGCPKKRAMEIIDEIEVNSRGIYTGCIGYILPNQNMEFNIAIRTIVKQANQLYLGVGGGITIESKMAEEFDETLAKAQSFLKK